MEQNLLMCEELDYGQSQLKLYDMIDERDRTGPLRVQTLVREEQVRGWKTSYEAPYWASEGGGDREQVGCVRVSLEGE